MGPGRIWATAQSSMNSSFVSQPLRSTSSRCTTARTPPKPCRASQVKDQNSSLQSRGAGRAGRCSAGSESGSAWGGMGGAVCGPAWAGTARIVRRSTALRWCRAALPRGGKRSLLQRRTGRVRSRSHWRARRARSSCGDANSGSSASRTVAWYRSIQRTSAKPSKPLSQRRPCQCAGRIPCCRAFVCSRRSLDMGRSRNSTAALGKVCINRPTTCLAST